MSCRYILGALVCAVVFAQVPADWMGWSNEDLSTEVVNNQHITGSNKRVIGNNNHIQGDSLFISGNNNVVKGSNAFISGNNAQFTGNNVNITGNNANVRGHGKARIHGNNARVDMEHAWVIGNNARINSNDAEVNGNNAHIVGGSAKVVGNNAGITGDGARVTGTNAYIDGNSALVCSDIGRGLTVTGRNVDIKVNYKYRDPAAQRRRDGYGYDNYDNKIRVLGGDAKVTSEESKCLGKYFQIDKDDHDYDVTIKGEGLVVSVDSVVVTGKHLVKNGNNITIE